MSGAKRLQRTDKNVCPTLYKLPKREKVTRKGRKRGTGEEGNREMNKGEGLKVEEQRSALRFPLPFPYFPFPLFSLS